MQQMAYLYRKEGAQVVTSCALIYKLVPFSYKCPLGYLPGERIDLKTLLARLWFKLITMGNLTIYYTTDENRTLTHTSYVVGKCFKFPFLPKCSHELVALQDVEAISMPNRFEKQLAYFNEHPDIAVLGSYFQEIDANSLKPIDVHPVPQTDRKIRRCIKTRCPFQHGTVMFKKSAVLDSGNYEAYPMFLDDYYLWVRILGKGYKGANLSDVLVSMPANPDLTWGRAIYLFLADRDLCTTMRQLKLMGGFTYYLILVGRFIKYFLIPNKLRLREKWIYN